MPVIPAPEAATHQVGDTRFTSLATPTSGSTDTSVWLVEIAPGAPATPHQLTREEVFVVLDGSARVRIDGEACDAKAGDAIVVPPGTIFEIAAVGETTLRALCCMPVGGQAQIAEGAPFTPPWAG